MPTTSYSFFNWVSNYPYTKWDVAQGLASNDSRFYYSLIDGNVGAKPVSGFIFTPTSSTRLDDVNRLYFTQTGTAFFQPGSVIEVANISPDSSINYSGVCLAGGSGYVDYLNPGLSVTNSITTGVLRASIHPYWTTGFAWIPAWSSDVTHNQSVITANLGEGYQQRSNPCINANSLRWSLAFTERTDKEARALLNFLQEKGGVGVFTLPFPVGNLYNTPGLKYVNGVPRHSLTSFGLNNVSVECQEVFDL